MLDTVDEIEELMNSIVDTTKDYKNGKVMSKDHVEKWIEQFNESSRLTILKEIDHILKKHYVSKERTAEFMELLINKKEIVGDFKTNYPAVSFLEIQRKGESQRELLELLGDTMEEKFDIKLSDCGKQPNTYIYFDDCMFSGNTAFWDIKKWANENEIQNVTLHLVFLAMYNSNYSYLTRNLKSLFKGKNVEFKFWRIHEFSNNAFNSKEYLCLWPTEHKGDDVHVTNFRKAMEEQREQKGNSRFPLFRSETYPTSETLFTSKEARVVVEQAFLTHGAYLYTFTNNPSFKPMGYSYFSDLGFGSLFVTYRNIANNSPLVLWWGDINQKHLNQWYPLFPRRVN
ncbi:hypothetical protein NLX78_15250 [Paenibacillus sp. Lou8.1]|uniref:phosphoribosyltransferase-like protein n=1 Tax=unclassified Paenibacillus TaxID=185978 RepID=UPI0020B6CA50|nr:MULTISPECIES: hypothetical protein [unclassified Paenibacillus]MCP3779371.1 hypothetical protein [Paenibacillus sp. MZ03-122A]MCP3808592.1 hypothetical protein [Paenibacillus sp. Lou8.1]